MTNLFIVDDDKLMVKTLEHQLYNKFGKSIQISTFYDGDDCLKKVDKDTDIVILDYFMEGKNGLEVLKLIKSINPKAEVIMLSNSKDIVTVKETFRAGAKEYVIKGADAWNKVTQLINYIVTEPLRIMGKEYGVSKFIAIFILTYIMMAIITLLMMRAIQLDL